jgi:hypothetical protein
VRINTLLIIKETFMLSMSNATVSTKAAAGAIVGNLSLLDASANLLTSHFQLTEDCAGFFYLNGNSVVTMRAGIPPGFYSLSVNGVSLHTNWSEDSNFTIQVTST